jgi:VWFA-related protein
MPVRLSTLLSLFAAASLMAQQPVSDASSRQDGGDRQETAQPTFRTSANYVRVDMYAMRDGEPVEDLQPGEIDVLEDDVPQTIEDFEHVKVRTATPQDARIEPRSVEESRQMAAEARARVFVIFIDTYHTTIEGSATMRLPLIRFLDRVLGPDDLVALMSPEMAASDVTFGRKTTVISNIMQTEWTWGRRNRLAGTDDDPKERLYRFCYPEVRPGSQTPVAEMIARRREKLTLDALEDLIVHLGGIREERKAVLAVTEGWLLYEPNTKLAVPRNADDFPPPLVPPRAIEPVRGEKTPADVAECDADRVALSLIDHSQRLRQLSDEANRGNVTFYPVYARGLTPFDSDIGPERPPDLVTDGRNLRTRQDNMRFLADNTDGTSVINTNNIDGALKRITDDLSSYYLLGYYSTNTKLDGRFRSITVRVKRPGVRVRARRGYRGRTADEVVSSTVGSAEADAVTTALNAVASFSTRSPFRARAASWAQPSAAGGVDGSFWLVGELDYRTRRELAWTPGAIAEITVVSAAGEQVFSRTMDVKTTDGSFALRVPESGAVPPGEYAVRVRVQPQGAGDLAVTDVARVIVPETPSWLGEPILWRRGPSTGPRYLRTADPRFQRSERLRLEFPTPAAAPSASARLLDRTGTPLPIPLAVSERPEPSGDTKWIVVDATLAPMAAGDYAIEVTQGGVKQLTAFRVVP